MVLHRLFRQTKVSLRTLLMRLKDLCKVIRLQDSHSCWTTAVFQGGLGSEAHLEESCGYSFCLVEWMNTKRSHRKSHGNFNFVEAPPARTERDRESTSKRDFWSLFPQFLTGYILRKLLSCKRADLYIKGKIVHYGRTKSCGKSFLRSSTVF